MYCIAPVPGHMGYSHVLLVVGYYEKQCCEYLCICAQVPRDTAPILMDGTRVTEEEIARPFSSVESPFYTHRRSTDVLKIT